MGKLLGFVEYEDGELVNGYSVRYYYTDDKDRLTGIEYRLNYLYSGGSEASGYANYSFFYDSEDKLVGTYVDGLDGARYNVGYVYDKLDRVRQEIYDYTGGYTNSVERVYRDVTDRTNGQLEKYTTSVNGGTGRSYDFYYLSDGNIVKVIDSVDGEIRYQYDDIDQLVREDNSKTNETYIYTYDNAGNILSKKVYTLTAVNVTPTTLKSTYNYGYSSSDWGDLLTSYRGTTITYDGIGNPLSYYNGTSYTFNWFGRELVGATVGNKTLGFAYDDNGIRTAKVVNGVKTTYYLSGSQIIAEETSGNITVYYYDADGAAIGYKYHAVTSAKDVWEVYFFERNAHGDIISVYGSNGTKYVSYSYDAWGNATVTYHNGGASTKAASNPFRYRGYYYDSDLGLYYLNARYYDSKVSRFISPDFVSVLTATPTELTDKNLYAYCDNNPVMRTDGDGAFWDIAWDAVSFGMSVVDVICNPSDAWAWAGLAGDLIDVAVPFVSGVGEATDAIRIATKMDDVVDIVDDIHDAAKAIDNVGDTIGSYSDLRKIAKGTGNEVHHIVEQRFVRMHPELGDPLKMDSIILDKETHRIFTNRWRRELSYGSYYLKEQIITAGERVYKDFPSLLQSFLKTMNGVN